MNFIDDKEKMKDFVGISKDDFLKSYSYLTEKEYDETKNLIRIKKYIDKEENMQEIRDEISKFLKSNEEYENYSVEYILIDKENSEKSFAFASNYDEMIEVNITSHEITSVADWAYNFDEDIFKRLEDNNEIAYMNVNTHYAIWQTIQELYPEEIDNKKGMQKYLKYCKDNKITKELIEKETKFDDVPNIMKFYEKDKKSRER